MPDSSLKLTKVLQDEYHYFHNVRPEAPLTWLFKRDHILKPEDLVKRLKGIDDKGNPLTRYIYSRLPMEAQEQLKQYNQDGAPPESLQNYIVETLNALLTDPGLGDIEGISEDIKAAAEQDALRETSTLTPCSNGRARTTTHESIHKVTREVTREKIGDLTHQVTHEATYEIVRDTLRGAADDQTARRTIVFNRRLFERVYEEEICKTEDTLSGVFEHIHRRKHAALCLSGGGIRSATFCLGVIQALAELKLLDRFHYLSTVSGGGYIGSWLSAWSHRHPNGLPGVMKELSNGPVSSTEPEPSPVSRLRCYSSYLTPRIGLFSGDTWAFVGTYLRNLVLNWFVLVPLLAAAVIIPRLYIALTLLPMEHDKVSWVLAIGLISLVASVAYIGFNRPSTGNRRRGQEVFLLACLLPMLIAAACLAAAYYSSLAGGYDLQNAFHIAGLSEKWFLPLLGAALNALAWSLQFLARTRRPQQITLVPSPGALKMGLEFLAIVATGFLGGLLVWGVANSDAIQTVSNSPELYACIAVPLILVLLLITQTVFVGLVSAWTTDEDREWWARAGGWILLTAIAWAAAFALVFYGPDILWAKAAWLKGLLLSVGSASGVTTILAGKSAKTPAKQGVEPGQAAPGAAAPGMTEVQPLLVKVALPVFVVFLIVLISKGVDWLVWWGGWSSIGFSPAVNSDYPWTIMVTLLIGLVVVSAIMSWVINVNRFSLNAMYRSRLIRAYLGASRNYRNPNPFTGFDPEDNLQMHELGKHNSLGIEKKNLFHVLSLTLNLVSGDNPAWQERKAESFTVSPLHCGNHELGYRPSDEYTGKIDTRVAKAGSQDNGDDGAKSAELPKGISLGTAVSISGAAASPNMGYNSSAPLAFLLTLFNVRLGAWFGNPGEAGERTYGLASPRFGQFPLLRELFGMTNDRSPYVYLSDGGHFENLGLYEMVLRRCHYIVVVDAGHDPKCSFADLGNAIRKIRTDLGVPIELHGMEIYPRSDDKSQNDKGTYYAIGTIFYSAVDRDEEHADDDAKNGKLLYIKPAFYNRDEPRDVCEYAKRCPEFPHESTANQWFGESQFESYRALGQHAFRKAYEACGGGKDIERLFDGAAAQSQSLALEVLGWS